MICTRDMVYYKIGQREVIRRGREVLRNAHESVRNKTGKCEKRNSENLLKYF